MDTEKQKIRNKKWRDKNRPYLRQKAKEYYLSHKEDSNKRVRTSRRRWRLECLTHYGNGKLACVLCGFSDERALCIDHINNDGAEHRRRVLGKNSPDPRIYLWLRINHYPEGYQTLCSNCNTIKEVERRKELRSC